jgi:hypothetical protein
MGKRQYSVSLVADRIGEPRECLEDISEINGRVVSIVWQPERRVSVPGKPRQRQNAPSGFVVVAEFLLPDAGSTHLSNSKFWGART